jgi:peptidoglycan-N-acetylglucosamine deacetylase
MVAAALPVEAQQACTTPGSIGVSRTIEIDTKGGPWFGAPHGDPGFLAPGEVVLTFDDGPSPRSTRHILAALAAQCTKATFFVVGAMAAAYPDVVREMAAEGHTIGTHTWSHLNLKRLSQEHAKAQIESAFTAVEKAAGGAIAPFFRYPYLSDSHAAVAYLQERDIAQFAIDIDSLDWRTRNPQSIIRRVMAGLEHRNRGIILLHDIHPSTAAAVPELLSLLKAKGFRIVHIQPKTAVQTLAAYQPPAKGTGRERAIRHLAVRTRLPNTGWSWPTW